MILSVLPHFRTDAIVRKENLDRYDDRDDIQDDVNITRKCGNIFLTNIHRVYAGNDVEPSFEDDDLMDYFLGKRPTGKTTDSKVDLGDIVREIDELVVLNDEVHHIHDNRLAWSKSIEDIHNRLKQKDHFLSLQVDVTATPKHNNGAIFVQTDDTKKNGEIFEAASGKAKEELERLRKQSNEIDGWESPFKVIVSVLMLKEGWDVKNVTTIVGLRAYSSKSNILPEQTLGRGLRRMYPGFDAEEYVSVVGTDAFMDFVESIQSEGVELERKAMGQGTKPKTPIIVEVDNENSGKDLEKLDIRIPVLTPRIFRNYKNLEDLAPETFSHKKILYRVFSEEEKREIVFKDITTGEISHTTVLDSGAVSDYRSVIGYFTQTIMKDLRLVSGYDVLYGKVKEFIRGHLFELAIEIDDLNTLPEPVRA